MPSVKRPIPENVKPYAAKLSSMSKPPIYNFKAQGQSQVQFEEQFAMGGTRKQSMTQLGFQQVGIGSKHMKTMSSDPNLMTIDQFQKSTQKRDHSPNDMEGDIYQEEYMGFRPVTSTEGMTGGIRGGSTSMGKSVSNPQFTTLNMAPYSRPQTQAFGFRNQQVQKDPSKKQARASEEITSITGLKTMTALGPSAMNRPKTSNQDLLKKRGQSNKALKRRIIGGRTDIEDQRRMLVERINEEDEERKKQQFNNSPNRKANEKILGGNAETTDEILRSHFLMAKIRKKTDMQLIPRPQTSEEFGDGNRFMMSETGQRTQTAQSNFRGAIRPGKMQQSMGGKTPFGRSLMKEQIDEQLEEELKEEYLSNQLKMKVDDQLDVTKSDKVVTNLWGSKQNGATQQKQGNIGKWNDLDKLITLLQNQPDDDGYFIYLKPSETGDPYDLQPLIEAESMSKSGLGAISKKNQNQQKQEKFFTLSKKGITTYVNDEPVEYISLTDWLIERNFFQQIRDKQFFRQFKSWKIVRMWRRNILQKKREEVRNNLTEKLFCIDDTFGSILMKHRKACKDMESKLRILDLNQNGHEVFTLSEFSSNQNKRREDVVNKIEETSDMCRGMFRQGITDVLDELRQKINDQNEDEESHKKEYMRGDEGKDKKTINSDPVFEQLGFKHNLKYGPRSKLRRACSRFLRFSYLLDFIAMEALANIYIESVKDTITKLGHLSHLKVDFELRPKITQFGDQQQQKKVVHSQLDTPFFYLNAIFEEREIVKSDYIRQMIRDYSPTEKVEEREIFDPTVHLLIKPKITEEELGEEQPEELEEQLLERITVINLSTHWLKIEPEVNDFSSLINECFQEGLECLKHFERWSRHEDLLPYVKVLESWDDKVCDEWDPPDDNNLNCDEWLQENPLYENQAQYVNDELILAFGKIQEFFQLLEPYLLSYWENKRLGDLSIVENEDLNNPLEVIPLLLQRFEDQKANFENYIPEQRDLGMIRVQFRDVKNQLTPSPKNCLQTLKRRLPSMIKRRMEVHKDWLLQQIQSISSNPSSVDIFVQQLQSIEYIERTQQEVKDKIQMNNDLYETCLKFELEGKEEKNKKFIGEIYKIVFDLGSTLNRASESISQNREEMKTDIINKIPILKKNTEDFMATIKQEKFLDIKSNMVEILEELDGLEVQIKKLTLEAKKITEYQITLEFDQKSQFDNVEEARIEFGHRIKLWRALNEWMNSIQIWKNAMFDQIEVNVISTKADLFTKTVLQCERALPGSTTVQHLKKLVFDFRDTMPIVEALGNSKLQLEHWNMIKQLLNREDFPLESKEFTLQQLIKMKVSDFQDDIVSISITATQEFNLRAQVAQIKDEWDREELKTSNHKDKADVYKIVEIDVMQNKIDDALANMSNIMGSRYVKGLIKEAEEQWERLNVIYETFERWKECQKNWIYLDNIFVSNDIRKHKNKEFQEFDKINKMWVALMKNVNQKNSLIKNYCNKGKIIEFDKHNQKMDWIQKQLDEYLDEKRVQFPRFYFLSNDELLQILACAPTDVEEIEKHINKCFDNINALMFQDTGVSIDLKGMKSQEKEEVEFYKAIRIKSGVEVWMKQVEEQMLTTISRLVKDAYKAYDTTFSGNRNQWVMAFCGQAIAVSAQLIWTENTEQVINDMEDSPFALEEHLKHGKQQLAQLTELIRGDLKDIKRRILVSLITTDIHNRDIVETLTSLQVSNSADFNWQQQLRYSMVDENSNISNSPFSTLTVNKDDQVIVRQVNSTLFYSYEYMGATSRLVITPLTDRCWITITGAMYIHLGAAPAGPAGTGKTESTKDLAKALGIYCVVFNCSEQIEYKMMARLFSGLAQSGAWSCLDEFNRIEVEVLSVIAQQLLDIKQAKTQDLTKFWFNDKEMDLKVSCGVFITMNPGYAGRTELPDNLKVLFRPVSMMIPAYGLIAEIMLQAEGFGEAKSLSAKMVQLYKLASEQLSQQDHYDFGMRAVKSVLVMAGTLKRQNPFLDENVVLIRAMRDSNIPKFLADDLPLFSALIQDLFPGLQIPEANFDELSNQIEESLQDLNLQIVPEFINKTIQLFDTFNVRFGVMIVGPTGGGKSTCFKVLKEAMSQLRVKGSKDQRFQEVFYKVLNPKSISMGELYGEDSKETGEWADGLASKIIREFAKDDTEKRNWCVFDGPVDALWIENMNTVLDDNMTLCLANGERIKLKQQMRMLFEVQDLSVASPATVSRCGMVYMTPSDLGWRPYMMSWVNRYLRGNNLMTEEEIKYLVDQFNNFMDIAFEKTMHIKHEEALPTVPVQVVTCICNFLEYYIKVGKVSFNREDKEAKKETERKINFYFGYSFIWGFGLQYKQSGMKVLDNIMRDFFGKKLNIKISETVYEYFFQEKEQKVIHWEDTVPLFEYDPKAPFFSILVPTVDTVRYTSILDILVQIGKQVFFTGSTGVGKSIIIQKYIQHNSEKQGLTPIMINFSAQSTSPSTQQTIESKLIKKKGASVLGANGSNTCVIFVDDVNMPMVEKYGAQPPIELLRQLVDHGGFYDRPAFFFKNIDKFITICSAAPPGGGRSALTPRFMRHFHILCVPDPSEYSMKKIFESIIEKFLLVNSFSDQVKKCGSIAVASTIELYTKVAEELLPIPAKFHYTFNLRDIAKVFQGMLQTKPAQINNSDVFARLWLHECQRVFYDRLINEEDRERFREIAIELIRARFGQKNVMKEDVFYNKQIIFSMLLRLDAEEKLYEEIIDKKKLLKVLDDNIQDYNLSKLNQKMDLVFFDDAVSHICRISRILRQPRGNAMLIGVSGCGKQSLTRLASSMLEYSCFQIKLSKSYKQQKFREDLKEKMTESGCDAISNTFLMTDTQIMYESFLEDLNNILNTGEITNLYGKDDNPKIAASLQKLHQQMKLPETSDYFMQTFIQRLRDNFHIILCMSPVGDQLRIRCRKFPSLVNCCTLDWFDNWPEDALINVSKKFILPVQEIEDMKVKDKLSEMFMRVHQSVEEMSDKFYQELRRKVYITPKSYLDCISLYMDQLSKKKKESSQNISRLSNGITKLQSTNEQIAELRIMLTKLKPQLEIENKNAEIQAIQIKESKVNASQKERETIYEAQVVEEEAQEIEQLKKAAEVELAKAKPAMEEAESAVNSLNKDHVNELKGMNNVVDAIHLVCKCVLIYLDHPKYDWKLARQIMQDKFLEKLKTFKKDDIPPATLNKVKEIVTKQEFDVELITIKSTAAGGLAKWCKAIYLYAQALKVVKPIESKLKEMQEKFADAMQAVEIKQKELAEIKAKLAQLEHDFQKTEEYIQQLSEDKIKCESRLVNAGKLIELLQDEGERWKVTVEQLNKDEGKLNGNVFIAAASISYIGPFTGMYRELLVDNWVKLCAENKIQVSEKYSLVNTLGDPVEIRGWGLFGLPSDSVSIDNGILATKTQRWALMIDPQTQANTWIKKMYRAAGLRVIKLGKGTEEKKEGKKEDGYQQEMVSALVTGQTVLIEDVGEEIDPGLDSVLTKSIYKDEGLEKINFADRALIYDNRFKLFLTTKLPNPHFLPEICIKLTIINFTVTFDGLEEQLLVDVVKNEQPEVEKKRDDLVMQIAGDKNNLKMLESSILQDLSNSSQETILDNVPLIKTLETSKQQSKDIAQSLSEAELVEQTINEVRSSYKEVSIRGSILYFVIADLAGIDPMYQNSLMYVKKLFNYAIVQTEDCSTLEERIIALMKTITQVLYTNICRGLFEAHKLIYSFMICSSIKRQAKQINEVCWNYLLRGPGLFNKTEQPLKPDESGHFISDVAWDLAYCLEMNVKSVFGGLCNMIRDNLKKWEEYSIYEDELYLENIPNELGEKLTIFQKLLILKIFKPEKIMFAVSKYVETEQGRVYAESPIATMDSLYGDSDNKTPIIFVLSQGADPTEQVIQFAKQRGFQERLFYKSLGQGQQKTASKMIEKGQKEGHWVLLQNCHLFKSWMPSLEAICESFKEDMDIHPDFRIFMTSMPADYFPVAILQNGLKMTTEPPRGLKANLKRTYQNMINAEEYNAIQPVQLVEGGGIVDNSEAWKRLLFGLSFFHAIVQERRKFGPLGWNIRYEFNDSDLDTSIKMLKNFLSSPEVPWDAMKYMTGQINYGGRVTDDWDRTLLLNILQRFYTDDILIENYSFSQSGVYFVPTHSSIEEIQQYIEELPLTEEPEVFGMHQNANIAYQAQESEKIIMTVLNVQPRVISGIGGKTSEEIIFDLAFELEENMPMVLDREDHAKDIFKLNSKGLLHCLSTVLLQEIERYNKLLNKMNSSLKLLMNAIKGFVIMSPELDLMFSAFLKNQVPPNWQDVSYPSLKPLASWIKDLNLRVQFMRDWLKLGHPHCYWLSGFFFPHGFMTGTLQTYARKHLEAIDLLEFQFKVLPLKTPEEVVKAPDDGIYVNGLYIEGARWSADNKCLEEQMPGEMTFLMPVIHFLPIKKKVEGVGSVNQGLKIEQKQQEEEFIEYYKCPCYKTSVRAGILSTTGQSTNFILAIDLPCSDNESSDHWTLRGTALLSMLNE